MSNVDAPVLALEHLDRDGALQETAEKAFGRSDFLRKTALGGGGLLGAGLLSGVFSDRAKAAGSPRQDVDILNFALTLEYLEAEFYVQGVRFAGLTGRLRSLSIVVRNHELAHVRTLKQVLGANAVAKPRFSFGTAVRNRAAFHSTAIVLEDTGVAAYGGQVQNINQAAVLNAAAQIHAVEARHAAAFRQLKGLSPAPLAFNPLKSKEQVLAAVKKTGFIVG